MAQDNDHIGINPHQQEFNDGQKEINGALCYVDWHIIYSINALIKALEDAGLLTEAQLHEARKKAKRAYYTSRKVAEIDPPGCGQNFQKEEDEEEDPAVVRAA